MRIVLDEDSQSRLLQRLLAEAGHDVLSVNQANLTSHSDAEVLQFAAQTDRIVLTRNVTDFLALHESDANHSGILATHEDRDVSKNMNFPTIVQAIGNLERSGWDIAGQFVSLNAWSFDPPTE